MFRIQRSYDNPENIIGVQHLMPSFTTAGGGYPLLPSMRVFEVDSDTNVLVNQFTYRLDLDKWNKLSTDHLEFDLAYDFLSEYGVPDFSLESHNWVVEQLMVCALALFPANPSS